MKHLRDRIELVGTIKDVNIQRRNNTRRIKLFVETEDLHEGIKLRLPVTAWESEGGSELDLMTTGTAVHIVGKVRVQNQTTAYRVEKTVRDIVASKVETI
jgi:hypothetical protein